MIRIALVGLVAACGGAPQNVHTVTVAPLPTCQCPQTSEVDTSSRFTLHRPPELGQLAKQRMELAQKRITLVNVMYNAGAATLNDMLGAYRDLALATRDAGLSREEERSALEQYRDAVKQLVESARKHYALGMSTEESVVHAEIGVLEAEYWLAEAAAGR